MKRDSKFGSLTTCGFARTEVLEQEGKEEAQKRLDMLVKHRGVAAVMEEYKWRVGKLMEISPVGRHADKLGFNMNQGEVIALRLRQRAGFRSLEQNLSVLCHELAHNVHGPHNEAFHRLDRELRYKVERLNVDLSREWWTRLTWTCPESGSRRVAAHWAEDAEAPR
eukprot:g46696.t1